MSKVRVYELARELDISSKELVNLLASEFNVIVKNHMSVVEEEDAELIKELFTETNSTNGENGISEKLSDKNLEEKKDIVEEYEEILSNELNSGIFGKNKNKNKNKLPLEKSTGKNKQEEKEILNEIEIGASITVKELSEKLDHNVNDVIKQLIFLGVMAGINQEIDFDTAKKLGEKFSTNITRKEEELTLEEVEEDTEDSLKVKRPPVVTVMGHVDHGKTSLLDAIRSSRVTETEAGGITQHIGAYTVTVNGEKITFLDTPGHEAFTAMRARGAQITDIVILVVAADDGIMPQTKEAIDHCKAAGVPIIVAINKIDKEGANPDRVKQELTEFELVPEDWGGTTICVEVSAKARIGISDLLEMVLLTAEIEELKANENRNAQGTVIESKLDKGRGAVATLLVQNGTLHTGDSILVGDTYGRIRAMFDDKGKKLKHAGPSIPVEILGLSEVPKAGDRFTVIKDEKTARELANKRKMKTKEDKNHHSSKVSLEDLYSQIKEGKIKELSVIVKADVQGSIDAIRGSLEKLSTESVKVRVLRAGVGAITETDVTLASASNALIIGFNVRPEDNAIMLADKEQVEIKTYRIIYDAIEDIKSAMIGMLDPDIKEEVLGRAEVRQIYKISSIGTIAGCYVLNGKILRNSNLRLIRDGIVIFESTFSSLKRFKDDVREVSSGYECGLSIDRFNDIKEGDIIESYVMKEFKRTEL